MFSGWSTGLACSGQWVCVELLCWCRTISRCPFWTDPLQPAYRLLPQKLLGTWRRASPSDDRGVLSAHKKGNEQTVKCFLFIYFLQHLNNFKPIVHLIFYLWWSLSLCSSLVHQWSLNSFYPASMPTFLSVLIYFTSFIFHLTSNEKIQECFQVD